jgi:hypothetical protein
VARCTTARLMRQMGLSGAIRGKAIKTTIGNPAAPCPRDKVNRQFRVPRSNALWVADFTYVATWQGFVYVAFVIDAFARRIVGWRVSRSAEIGFVLDALEQALYVIRRSGPWRHAEAVEFATLEWVDWFNHRRLLEAYRQHPSRRSRGALQYPDRRSGHRRLTQANLPPGNPVRFSGSGFSRRRTPRRVRIQPALTQGAAVDSAIGQGAVIHSPSRGAWVSQPTARWAYPAPDAGARDPTRRHGRDRRILSATDGRRRSLTSRPRGRGRKDLRRTTKQPVLAVVQRPSATARDAPADDTRAAVVANLSMDEIECVIENEVDPGARLMSDEWKAFGAVGQQFPAHETVQHGRREYVRGPVHANSAEGFNLRVQRTVAGLFHHISPEHADFYFYEIGFRWSQRIAEGEVIRRTRHGREKVRTLWSRVPPALQLPRVFRDPRRHRPIDAPHPYRRDHHQVPYRCLWTIKACYKKLRFR